MEMGFDGVWGEDEVWCGLVRFEEVSRGDGMRWEWGRGGEWGARDRREGGRGRGDREGVWGI